VPTLHVTGLKKSYGAHVVYDGVSFRLPPGERLALIGRNGTGKTTLLRTIIGEIDADAGDVGTPKSYRIALHDQRPPIAGAHTLGSYVGEGLADVHAAEDRLRELERRMAEGDHSDDVLRAYAHAQSELEAVGGYAWRARFEEILRGLSFTLEDADRPLGSFSGGELTRASLARVLAAQPDLLLLDEPTNHLDLRALEWLEDQLTALDCSILLVSHDRWFLERVATGVLELEFGRSKHYAMGYSSYRREKAMALANQADAFERQQAEIERLQRFVDKFRAGTRSRQAQSKVKQMNRMQRVEAPRRDRSLAFGFSKVERSSRIVIEAEKLTLRAGDKPLLDDAGLVVERGQRVAVIGPNGAGKTSLVETLLGLRPPVSGRIKLGHNVTTGYFSQHIAEMPEHLSVVDAMTRATGGHLNSTQSRTILGNFLFTQEEVDRKVGVLSGGERRRLALAALVAGSANLLVLDEPTNHLDVEAREALEEALDAYDGTVLLVSHDRALIDAVATHTASIEDRTIKLRHGDYNDYLEAVAERAAAPAPLSRGPAGPAKTGKPQAEAKQRRHSAPRTTPTPATRRPSQRTQRLIRDLESGIAKLEAEQAGLEATLSDPATASDRTRLSELGTRYQQVQEELAWKLLEWERVQAGDGLEV
jgi:ATP-binding cassette subfamily F protein 3